MSAVLYAVPGAWLSMTAVSASPVVVIAGPTASGKSALALALAERLNGVVINADSMQLYRELRVLTARPDEAALLRAPHRLYGGIPGDRPCSAGRWRDLALTEITAAHAAGKRPIVVGGTGLYLHALITGIADIPPVPADVRAAAAAHHRALGGAAFHAELAARDPESAARLAPGDTQRLIRAWEVLESTGRPLGDWQAETLSPPPHLRFSVIVLMAPRAAVYRACDRRLEAMVKAGALDEVRDLLALGYPCDLPVMKALGVPELAAALRGELALAEAVAGAQRATRRYAKRQLTWFRHRTPRPGGQIHHSLTLEAQYSESLLPIILPNVRN